MNNDVLIVDDDEILRGVTCIQIKKLGFTCVSAKNGADAVALVDGSEFRLILMDVQMPLMDGLEATIAIREIERKTKRTREPIVAMTASPNRDICLQSGMDDFLFKPILLGQLKSMTDQWIVPD